MFKYIIVLVVIFAVLLVLAWLGLRIQPKPFEAYPMQPPIPETIPLQENLPAPVKRYYREIYGERIPLITSAVISGRAKIRRFGLTLPARFRFTHEAGQNYRHYIEATFFGIPLLKVNERYYEGVSRMEILGDVTENDPKINQAANLGLWAESIWLPSIFLTDPRVRWEAVDNQTALLIVPFGDEEQTFVARFDPQTGLIRYLEVMRYKEETKILWINEVQYWRTINGYQLPYIGAVTWFDDGRPWAVFAIEEVVYNADVSEYVRATGL